MTLISVIMAAYNAGRYIEESIACVQAQTYGNWELIIVNDGSTDDTLSIAESYSKQDHRIRVISQENKRLGPARNTGIRASKGEWLIFLDQDDLWEPTILEKQLQASLQYPQADVIYTDGWIFYNDNLTDLEPYITITGQFSAEKMYVMEYDTNYIPVQSALVRRSVIEKIGMQEEHKYFFGCEDYDYWLRLAKAGAYFYGIPEKLFYYRRHPNSFSNNIYQMWLAKTSVLIKNYDAKYFNGRQPEKISKSYTYPLVAALVKQGKKAEACFLLNGLHLIKPSFINKLVLINVNLFGRLAFVPLKVINKFNELKV